MKKTFVALGLVVAVLLGLIVAVSTRTPAMIMEKESAELTAKRQSPQNAFLALSEVTRLLPEPPVERATLPPQVMARQGLKPAANESTTGPVGRILGMAKPDDDPQLAAYLDKCAPFVEKSREILLPAPWGSPSQGEPERFFLCSTATADEDDLACLPRFTLLSRLYRAQAQVATRKGDGREAVSLLFDSLRLGQMMASDGPRLFLFEGYGNQRQTLEELAALPWHALPEADVRQALERTAMLAGTLSHGKANVECEWRLIDQGSDFISTYEPSNKGPLEEPLHAYGSFRDSWRTSKARALIREHKDALLATLDASFHEIEQVRQANSEIAAQEKNLHRSRPFEWCLSVPINRAFVETWYRGLQLVLAIELFTREQGHAPAALTDIVPAYLDALPADPFTGEPYVYRPVDGAGEGPRYMLYSSGENAKDDGGLFRKDILIPDPPSPNGTKKREPAPSPG